MGSTRHPAFAFVRAAALLPALLAAAASAPAPAVLTIDYPAAESIFPPGMTAPTFLWHDPDPHPTRWRIDIVFPAGPPLAAQSDGEPMPSGEIDARAVAGTNELPKPAPWVASAHSWKPDPALWSAIQARSLEQPATFTFTGFPAGEPARVVSRGTVTIRTSKDPVDAPIFYRDVPLMPSAVEKGVIKPLPSSAVPLVAWRLRDIREPRSRLLLEGLPTCANCHSFSRDGRTLGIDVDGPENDKGTYALAAVQPHMSIRTQDVITWNAFPGKPAGLNTLGFMSRVSPDGRYAISTVNEQVYVANFTDYRFLQVFYPTRGILGLYDRAERRFSPLHGADDPAYVHTNAVWSPDGTYLVFARAAATDAYPAGRPLATYSNDPNEVPIRYDLYRIPFNHGRGGQPEPIAGASANGMSNSFPKISPDGKWIVWVESRNGQLMRPDGRLYIVPAAGGAPRRMRCNTPVMNSWHSFSPNGRWLVFSSKSRSPYTQMFLTHIAEDGADSPAILIENSTAANRAVNIPEFVNIQPDALLSIDVPAAEFYRRFDRALELEEQGRHVDAVAQWRQALALDPADAKAHNNLGVALARGGDTSAAVAEFSRALALRPAFAQASYNLGGALARAGSLEPAAAAFARALAIDPDLAAARHELGVVRLRQDRVDDAVAEFERALSKQPAFPAARNDLGVALMRQGRVEEAAAQFRQAIAADPGFAQAHYNLGVALLRRREPADAIAHFQQALAIDPSYSEARRALQSARRLLSQDH